MKKIFLFLLFLLPPLQTAYADDATYEEYSTELNDKQREEYLKVFNYTMDSKADDISYHWKSGTASGDIRAGKKYISKSKSVCRNFSETYKVGDEKGQAKGAGCKRKGKPGWCKLDLEKDALTCALEPPDGFLEQIGDDTENMFRKGGDMMRGAKNWWNN